MTDYSTIDFGPFIYVYSQSIFLFRYLLLCHYDLNINFNNKFN